MSGAFSTHYLSCNLCEASCGLQFTLSDGQITDVRGHAGDPLSRGHICPKGVALQDLHTDPNRLRRPVRRVGDSWQELSWREAIRLVSRRLHDIQQRHGRDAVGLYLGNPYVHTLGGMTHLMHLLRAVHTRNAFIASSVDQLPHNMVAWALYGHQYLLPVPDIDRSELIILFGHNPLVTNGSLWTVPDFARRLKDLQGRGGRLIVVDPRRSETARVADEHHFIRPGTDALVLLAMIREVVATGRARPAPYVEGLNELRAAVEPFSVEQAATASGLSPEAIRGMAHALLAQRGAIHGRMGVSTQVFGLVCQWAIHVLNILTGNLDREGGAMFASPAIDLTKKGMAQPGAFARWHSRVRGLPEFDGYLPVSTLADEMLIPGPGQVRALLTVAGNPVSSAPGGQRLERAIGGLNFYVAIDPYIGATTRHADIILPPTGPLERDHYDMIFHALAVRNTVRFSPALFPRGRDARHEWEIVRDLSLALHWERRQWLPPKDLGMMLTPPRTAVDILLRSSGTGVSVKKLLQTPAGVDLGPLKPGLPQRLQTPRRVIHLLPDIVQADLKRVAQHMQHGQPAPEELLLIGRRNLRDNNSWMGHVERLNRGEPRHHLLMNPQDAARLNLSDGAEVRVTSRSGEIQVECRLSADMMPGVVSLPHGFGYGRMGASANDLTDPQHLDEASGNARLNGVPVRVSPVPPA